MPELCLSLGGYAKQIVHRRPKSHRRFDWRGMPSAVVIDEGSDFRKCCRNCLNDVKRSARSSSAGPPSHWASAKVACRFSQSM